MALEAGIMQVTVEYAQGIRDCDWFGRQDPYVIVTCGGQTVRSRTHVDGGKNPVWGETFQFNVINENTADLRIMDEDTCKKDDVIGECIMPFSKARETGADDLKIPVSSKKNKQRGHIAIRLKFTPNKALKA